MINIFQTTLYVPLWSIVTSIPVWGIIISSFCCAWSGYTLLIDLPNYLKNVLKFDLAQVREKITEVTFKEIVIAEKSCKTGCKIEEHFSKTHSVYFLFKLN